MLLAVDIGNTSIVLGIFKGKRLVDKVRMPTKSAYSLSSCRAPLSAIAKRYAIKTVIVSSVVPRALIGLEKALSRAFKRPVHVVGRDIKAPIRNLYKDPGQVGQDRLVNAVAAAKMYKKGGGGYTVVIDFGTAVTFDVLSGKGGYIGGIIFPGIRLSLENLVKRAALLPKVTINEPESLIGTDTKDSMRSGILHGYASLCDGIVCRIEAALRKKVEVIATGGDAPLIARHSAAIKRIDPDLILKGLRIIAEKL